MFDLRTLVARRAADAADAPSADGTGAPAGPATTTDKAPRPRRVRMVLAAVAALVAVVGLGGVVSTTAGWTDTTHFVGQGTVRAPTVDLVGFVGQPGEDPPPAGDPAWSDGLEESPIPIPFDVGLEPGTSATRTLWIRNAHPDALTTDTWLTPDVTFTVPTGVSVNYVWASGTQSLGAGIETVKMITDPDPLNLAALQIEVTVDSSVTSGGEFSVSVAVTGQDTSPL